MLNKLKFITLQNVISDVHISCTYNACINYLLLSKFIQHEIFKRSKLSLFLLSQSSRLRLCLDIYFSTCHHYYHHPSLSQIYILFSFHPLIASPVQYKITGGNEERIFRIHNTTGQIFIAAELDYEKVKKVSRSFLCPFEH